LKCFLSIGVEKNNDLAKKTYFRNSNKWDSAADIIKHQYQLWLLKNRKRKIGAYWLVYYFCIHAYVCRINILTARMRKGYSGKTVVYKNQGGRE